LKNNEALTKKTYNCIVTNFKQLRWLNIEGNQIGDEGLEELIQPFVKSAKETSQYEKKMSKLNILERKIEESNNPIKIVNNKFQKLRDLNVAYNKIGDRGASLISQLIKHAPKLKTLNLHYN
jgi:Ran GTPase-activating protein (RanGAP) involved in mRNA processing and transport